MSHQIKVMVELSEADLRSIVEALTHHIIVFGRADYGRIPLQRRLIDKLTTLELLHPEYATSLTTNVFNHSKKG